MSTESNETAADAAGEGEPGFGLDATLLAREAATEGASAPCGGAVVRARVGRYRVLGMLGSGGMGTVYEADDDRLDRRVAVKVLHQHMSERHRQRLVREARALARVSHPNVIHVYEVEESDGETFVAMELVRGKTLQEWVEHEPRPGWRACVEVYLQAGAGLMAVHAEGLVHRDFKPGNVIIDDHGRVRVLDFGLARRADDTEAMEAVADVEAVMAAPLLTTAGTVLGTPAYMSPEQMEGLEVDARSDQFSFCVSLYEAVYGERPFAGDTMAALMVSTTAGHVRPPPKGTAVPTKLRRALLRGLANEPERRWSSMEGLLAELSGQVAPAARRWLIMGVVGGLIAVGLGAGYYARGTGTGEEPAVQAAGEPQAAVDADEQAKLLYEEGKRAYRQGLFDEAVEKWSRSYELSEQAIVLYDLSLALCRRHEHSGDVNDLLRARSVMRNYLTIAEANPDLDADDAKERIAELDAKISERSAQQPNPIGAVVEELEQARRHTTCIDAQMIASAVDLYRVTEPGACPADVEALVQARMLARVPGSAPSWSIACAEDEAIVSAPGADGRGGTEDDLVYGGPRANCGP